MEGLASVDDGCKARVGGREDDVVDGCQVLVGVILRGDQVDEGDAPVFVRLTERYASIQEATA